LLKHQLNYWTEIAVYLTHDVVELSSEFIFAFDLVIGRDTELMQHVRSGAESGCLARVALGLHMKDQVCLSDLLK
jgi:hypothetical protein